MENFIILVNILILYTWQIFAGIMIIQSGPMSKFTSSKLFNKIPWPINEILLCEMCLTFWISLLTNIFIFGWMAIPLSFIHSYVVKHLTSGE